MSDHPPRVSRRTFLAATIAAAAAGGVTGVLARRETTLLEVEHRRLKVPGWTADGYRLAMMSDLHLRSDADLKLAFHAFDQALGANPAVIVIVGDFITARRSHEVEFCEAFLKGIRGHNVPTLGALGNHDISDEGWRPVQDLATERDAHLLVNEAVEVDGVTFFGYDDALKGHPEYGLSSQVDRPNVIGLLHEPDAVEEVPANVHLVLSGHSHGGQLCLPGGLPLHTPPGAKVFRRGWYPQAPRPLYVGRGLGTVGPPFRLNCLPELTVIDVFGA